MGKFDNVNALIAPEQPQEKPWVKGQVVSIESGSSSDEPTATNNVGNLRPVGSNTGFQQFNTPQEGIAAMDKNLEVYGSKHGINTLRGVISRYAPSSENDTENYINEVSKRTSIKPDDKIDLSNPALRHILSGAMMIQEKGVKHFTQQESQLAQQPQQQAQPSKFDNAYSLITGNAKPTAEVTPSKYNTATTLVEGIVPNQTIDPETNKPFDPDIPTQMSTNYLNQQQPEQVKNDSYLQRNIIAPAEIGATLVTGALAAPLSAAYGIGKNIVSGKFGTKEGTDIADKAAAEAQQELTYQPRFEQGQKTLESLSNAFEASKIPPIGVPEVMGLRLPEKAPIPIKPTLEQQFAKKKGIVQETPLIEPTVAQTPNIPKPTSTDPFPVAKYASKGNAPLTEQQFRKETLARVGFPEARDSTIKGNGFESASEYTTSNLNTPEGQHWRDVFSNERKIIENHAQKIISETGGTFGLDENTLYNRGKAQAKPFDEFKTVLKDEMNKSYDAAKLKSNNLPSVKLDSLDEVLKKNSNFSVNDKFKSLRNGVIDHLKEENILNKDGSLNPITVNQAEDLRKYINSNWDNEKSGLIHKLVDSIDNDVTLIAGEDVYKKSRAIREKIANLLDDPKGISKIMDFDPKNPMNRTTAFAKIPETIERMDFDQQAHLIKVLQDMPPELQPSAQKAIAEINAQIANRIYDEGSKTAGQWSSKNVSNYLKNNNKKIEFLTKNPKIAQMVTDLNNAGNFIRHDQSYKGAAIQTHNLIKSGAVPALTSVGTAIGGAVAGPLGAAVGGTIGARKGIAIAEQVGVSSAKKRMVNLKDVMNTGKPKQ
jgi:hypothetical protein